MSGDFIDPLTGRCVVCDRWFGPVSVFVPVPEGVVHDRCLGEYQPAEVDG